MSFGAQNSIEQRIQFEMVFGIITGCFNDWITDFKTREFSQSEQTCLSNCAMKSASTQELIMQAQQELTSSMGGSGSIM